MLTLYPLYGNIRIWVLHTFILLLPLNTWLENYPMIASTDILLISMLIVLLGEKVLGDSQLSKGDIYSTVVLSFLGVAFFSFLFSHYPKRGFWATFGIAKFVFLFLYIRKYVDSLGILKRTVKVFILSSIIPAFYGLITGWHTVASLLRHYSIPQYLRVQAGFPGGAIEFTYFILTVLSFILALWFTKLSFNYRLLLGFIAVINLLSFAVTFTRNGYISLGVGLLTFIILLNRRNIWRIVGAVLGLIMILVILPIPQLIVSRFSSLFSPSSDPSIMARPMLWKGAVTLFLRHPILGVGTGAFSFAFRNEYLPHSLINSLPIFASAHNITFNTMADLGLAGIILLFGLVFIYGRSLLKAYSKTNEIILKPIIMGLILIGVISLTFGLSDFVWWSQRSGTLTGFILGIMATTFKIAESSYGITSSKAVKT
jgi:O-antigen ligase